MSQNNLIPVVDDGNHRVYDLYSKLLKERIIRLDTIVTPITSNILVSSLLYLDHESHDTIEMHINSPGGNIFDGLAIIDTMAGISSPITTICCGQACSMAAVILACGDRRLITRNGTVMIHQPMSGIQGQASDIQIHSEMITQLRNKLNNILSLKTGKDLEEIEIDTDRNKWLFADDAVQYGIVDEIIDTIGAADGEEEEGIIQA